MSTPQILKTGRRSRGVKIALAAALALGLAMIALGVGGTRAFGRAGFDDAKGFLLINKAGRLAEQGLKADAALLDKLDETQTQALGSVMDDVLSKLWRRVRYVGETLPDYSRTDTAKRAAMMDTLLQETSDSRLAQGIGRASTALDAVILGTNESGLPAYEWLIDKLADSLPGISRQHCVPGWKKKSSRGLLLFQEM